jgi:hypothetical protein
MSSRAIVNGNNETMRDFLQDLKERNREERVRHYQNERKQEREKRWYRLRGSNVSVFLFFQNDWMFPIPLAHHKMVQRQLIGSFHTL